MHNTTCCSLVPRLTGSEPLTILPLTLEPEAAAQAHFKACDRLKLERKQRRMCRRDPGVAETLVEAVSMSALECQYQFRFERWNCTLEGRYRASLLKRGEWGPPRAGPGAWASHGLAYSQGSCQVMVRYGLPPSTTENSEIWDWRHPPHPSRGEAPLAHPDEASKGVPRRVPTDL